MEPTPFGWTASSKPLQRRPLQPNCNRHTDAVRMDAEDNNHAFAAALRCGDAAGAAALYADDAVLLPPSADAIEGRKAIAAFWRAGVDAGITEVEFVAELERRQDGLAVEIGRYVISLTPAEGASVADRGRYVLVHQRQPDGSWRYSAEMFNPDA